TASLPPPAAVGRMISTCFSGRHAGCACAWASHARPASASAIFMLLPDRNRPVLPAASLSRLSRLFAAHLVPGVRIPWYLRPQGVDRGVRTAEQRTQVRAAESEIHRLLGELDDA